MKLILQSLKNGATVLEKIPCPQCKPGHLLIQTVNSLVSAGTERMLVEFGKANMIQKAKSQPDKVKEVINKIKTDGLKTTLDAVKSKLDQPLPLGYCNAGIVIEVGKGVDGFSIGDRVVSNGPHASVVCVPQNLCAKIPDNVFFDEAAFTVLASIGLQGIRLVKPTLGETFVVTGLGLIGLMVVQLLRANGCTVIGADFDSSKIEMAKKFGAITVDLSKGEDPVNAAMTITEGRGVDGVIITAATKSNEPMHQAATMCRKRGRIVLVGVVGLELSRADFYDKELTFQVSCSYGPGRYDVNYEDKGHDYPFGFVRWTEKRNFEAILDLLASNRLEVKSLISHRFDFENSVKAYDLLSSKESSLGIILEYPQDKKYQIKAQEKTVVLSNENKSINPQVACCGFIGAGNYATRMLAPAFKKTNAVLKTIASDDGISGSYAAKKLGFAKTTTDNESIFKDESINTVVVVTQHDTHAKFVLDALNSNKHVFVEKPLCMNLDELEKIEKASQQHSDKLVMVGFNRRFSPHIQKIKSLLNTVKEPKSFIYTVNAGAIPAKVWVQDPQKGGGRILGEACHFIDLLRFLAGSKITSYQVTQIGEGPEIRDDKVTITLTFADGSFGTVHYLANGHKGFPKERLEIFCAEKTLQMDNFRKTIGWGFKGFKKLKTKTQDKGQETCTRAFVDAIEKGGLVPIAVDDIFEVSKVTIEIAKSLHH